MVTEKQKANLIPLNKRTKKEQRKIQVMGGIASGESRNWKSILNKCMGEHWDAPIEDDRMKAKLKKARLPQTYFGQLLYSAGQSAGRNPAMLRTILEAMDVLNGQQTNVTVNNTNPFANLTEDELRKLANSE